MGRATARGVPRTARGFGRLIMFDKRGTGLSDPVPTSDLPSIDEWMADVPAVLDAVGSERRAVITNIGGGIMAMTFAAAHPERVSRLVLVDCFARYLAAPDFPIGPSPEAVDASSKAESRARPAHARPVRTEPRGRRAPAPGVVTLRAAGRESGHLRRSSPDLRERRAARPAGDPRPDARHPSRRARGFRWSTAATSRRTSRAHYVELPGIDNLIWAGDPDAILAEIQAFVTGVRPAPSPSACSRPSCSRTSSTRPAGRPSSATPLARPAGRTITARLGSSGSAAARSRPPAMGSSPRSTAPPERSGARPRSGTACASSASRSGRACIPARSRSRLGHRGPRRPYRRAHLGLAGAGEVLVSGTVHDLVVGSGLTFADRGAHELKGVPGEWRVFAARA